MNNWDPFGTEIIKRYGAETASAIQEARKDSAFNANWIAMEQDDAKYLIFDDPSDGATGFTGSIHDGGLFQAYDNVQQVARSKNVRDPIRGYMRIPSRNPAQPQRCTVPHESIHMMGVVNGGTAKLSAGNPEFSRPYFDGQGCGGHR